MNSFTILSPLLLSQTQGEVVGGQQTGGVHKRGAREGFDSLDGFERVVGPHGDIFEFQGELPVGNIQRGNKPTSARPSGPIRKPESPAGSCTITSSSSSRPGYSNTTGSLV